MSFVSHRDELLVSPSNGSRKVNLPNLHSMLFQWRVTRVTNPWKQRILVPVSRSIIASEVMGMRTVGIFQQETRQAVWDERKRSNQGEVISYSYLCQMKGEGNGQL